MAEELQSLIDKIQSEGVDKANAKAAEIVAAAEKKAAEIVAVAEKKAAELRAAAEKDAAATAERSEQTLRQAGRNVVLQVGKDIEETLSRVLVKDVQSVLSTDFLQTYVEAVVKGSPEGAELHVAPGDAENLAAFARGRLAAEVAKGLKIAPDADVSAGVSVRLDGGRIEHDFSEKAVVEALSAHIRPQLAKIVFG